MKSSPLKRLVRDFAKQKFLLALALLGICLQVALTIYLPILIGNAVDAVLVPNNRQLIWSGELFSRCSWSLLTIL